MNRKLGLLAVILILAAAACNLQPDSDSGILTDGIVIYSGTEILNNATWEIVTARVQQLWATGPYGHKIVWTSSNPDAVDVDQTGMIRSGKSPNMETVITAASAVDPSMKAQVTFKTKGLR